MKTIKSHRSLLALTTVVSFLCVAVTTALAGPYTDAIIDDNPLLYWQMDETNGPTAATEVGSITGTYRLNQTTNNGSLVTQAGPNYPGIGTGTAVTFTGTRNSSGVPFPDATNVITTLTGRNADYSVELWFNNTRAFTAEGITAYLFSVGGGAGMNTVGIGGSASSIAGPGELYYFDGTTVRKTGDFIDLNTWYSLTMVVSGGGSDVDLYLNGSSIGDFSGSNLANSNNFVVGARETAASWAFQGAMDQVSVFNYALTAQQVADHWGAAAVPEPSTGVLIILGLALMAPRRRSRSSPGKA